MVEWLAPIALFWSTAALYLGGFRIEFKGGGALRHTGGLIGTFALYLVAWWALRAVLRGPLGTLGGIATACIIVTVLLPIISRIGFMIMGVRITKAAA